MMPLKAVAAVAVLALASPASAQVGVQVASQVASQVTWHLPTAYPAGSFHTENLALFASEVMEASGGRLMILLHPDASLFPATAIKSAVRIGQAQVGEVLLSLHEQEEAIFGVDVVPFLAQSYAAARVLWTASKPAIERKLAAQGLIALFAVPWPPQGIFAKSEINDIAAMKGLTWRVYNAATQRLAELVGAYPVTIQAADLPRALGTGLINTLITSGATGYDSRIWESMAYFYDAQAWIPKNVTFVNKAAFDALDAPLREAVLRAAAAAEARGWRMSEDRTRWYIGELAARGVKVMPPTAPLQAGLHQIGEQLTAEWLSKAGAEGEAIVAAYRKSGG
jgi:TRAP-type C4-dicarboxylate transport system substrate-binding protein